jgi:hypothetical protein
MEEQREGSNASTGSIVWEGALRRGTPARELEPTAAYRLGVDKGGGWRSPRKVTGWDNLQ